MFVYSIPMKFRYASGNVNYLNYQTELGNGQESYNLRADKMKKARKITEIKYESDGFVIILESKDELEFELSQALYWKKELVPDIGEGVAYDCEDFYIKLKETHSIEFKTVQF